MCCYVVFIGLIPSWYPYTWIEVENELSINSFWDGLLRLGGSLLMFNSEHPCLGFWSNFEVAVQ
jgi:hypothetical protein